MTEVQAVNGHPTPPDGEALPTTEAEALGSDLLTDPSSENTNDKNGSCNNETSSGGGANVRQRRHPHGGAHQHHQQEGGGSHSLQQGTPKQRTRRKVGQDTTTTTTTTTAAAATTSSSPKREGISPKVSGPRKTVSGTGARRASKMPAAPATAATAADGSSPKQEIQRSASGTGGDRVRRRSSLGVGDAAATTTKSSPQKECPATVSGVRKPSVTAKFDAKSAANNISGPLRAPSLIMTPGNSPGQEEDMPGLISAENEETEMPGLISAENEEAEMPGLISAEKEEEEMPGLVSAENEDQDDVQSSNSNHNNDSADDIRRPVKSLSGATGVPVSPKADDDDNDNVSPNRHSPKRHVKKTTSRTGSGRAKRRSSLGIGPAAFTSQSPVSKRATKECPATISGVRKPSVMEKFKDGGGTQISGPLRAPSLILNPGGGPLISNDDEDTSEQHEQPLSDFVQFDPSKNDNLNTVTPSEDEDASIFEFKEHAASAAATATATNDKQRIESAAESGHQESNTGGTASIVPPEKAKSAFDDFGLDEFPIKAGNLFGPMPFPETSGNKKSVKDNVAAAAEEPILFSANFDGAFVFQNDNARGHVEDEDEENDPKRDDRHRAGRDRRDRHQQRTRSSSRNSRSSRGGNEDAKEKGDTTSKRLENPAAQDGSDSSGDDEEQSPLESLLQFDFNSPEGMDYAKCNDDDTSIFRMNSARTLNVPEYTTTELLDLDKDLLDVKAYKKKNKKGFKLAPSKIFRKSKKFGKDNKSKGETLVNETVDMDVSEDTSDDEDEEEAHGDANNEEPTEEKDEVQDKVLFEKDRLRKIRERERAKHRHGANGERAKSKDSDGEWTRNRTRSSRSRDASTEDDNEWIRNKSIQSRGSTDQESVWVRNRSADGEVKNKVLSTEKKVAKHGKDGIKESESGWVRNGGKMRELYAGKAEEPRDTYVSGDKEVGTRNLAIKESTQAEGNTSIGKSRERRDSANSDSSDSQDESNEEKTDDGDGRDGTMKRERCSEKNRERRETDSARRAQNRAALKKAASFRNVPTRSKSAQATPSPAVTSQVTHANVRRRTHASNTVSRAHLSNIGWERKRDDAQEGGHNPHTKELARRQRMSMRKAQSVRNVPFHSGSGDLANNGSERPSSTPGISASQQRRRRQSRRDDGDMDQSMDRSSGMERSAGRRSGRSDMDKSFGSRGGIDTSEMDSSSNGDGSRRRAAPMDGSVKRRGVSRNMSGMDAVAEEGDTPSRGVQGSSSMRVERKMDSSFPDLSDSKSNLHKTVHNDGNENDRRTSFKKTLSVRGKPSAIKKGARNLIKGGSRTEKASLLADDDDGDRSA